jgi:CreA protein
MRKIVTTLGIVTAVFILALVLWIWSRPERGTTGQVSTNFRWLGPDDRIAVDGFDDAKVQGVACFPDLVTALSAARCADDLESVFSPHG